MLFALQSAAQKTFKCGWNTYKTATIVHEFTYSYVYKDSFKLYLADSTKTFVAPDSEVCLLRDYPFHDTKTYELVSYFNAKKKLVKSEEYKGNLVEVLKEFKYDDKNRKVYSYEENRTTGVNYKKLFEFGNDKLSGLAVVSEVSYFNGKIEFYTKSYFNKDSQKVKEVRLNDNNKDIVHVEQFFYNSAGRLKERSVYFPEFKVTKTFPEYGGDDPAKCFKAQPFNLQDRPSLQGKVTFLKKLLQRNIALLLDKDCHDFEYRFFGVGCEVIVSTTKTNNVKQVVFRYWEKVAS